MFLHNSTKPSRESNSTGEMRLLTSLGLVRTEVVCQTVALFIKMIVEQIPWYFQEPYRQPMMKQNVNFPLRCFSKYFQAAVLEEFSKMPTNIHKLVNSTDPMLRTAGQWKRLARATEFLPTGGFLGPKHCVFGGLHLARSDPHAWNYFNCYSAAGFLRGSWVKFDMLAAFARRNAVIALPQRLCWII